MKKNRWIRGIIGVCIILCLSGAGSVYAGRNDMTGATFRMAKTEGTVTVKDEKGSAVSITENMLLYSGDAAQTSAKSYAYINMDDSKLIKIDELSKAVLRKTGKKLEIGVEEGSVYFEVNKKLADDENMTIGDATISMSIRGTTGVFRKRRIGGAEQYTIFLLEGKASVSCSGMGTYQLWGGERIDYNAATGEMKRSLIRVTDIPGFAAVEIRAKQDVAWKIAGAGIDVEWIVGNADSKLASDQANNLSQFGNVFGNPEPIKQQTDTQQNSQSDDNSSSSGDDSSDDTQEDTGSDKEDTSSNSTLVISGQDSSYSDAPGEKYPAYVIYKNDEGENTKIWLTKESQLYASLQYNGVLDYFEIKVVNFKETPEDEQYYGVGEIESVTQIDGGELIYAELLTVDASLTLKNISVFQNGITLSGEKGALRAEEIILSGDSVTLITNDGQVQADKIRASNGVIMVDSKNGLTVTDQISCSQTTKLEVAENASISCPKIVNGGELILAGGMQLKNLENQGEGYFIIQKATTVEQLPVVINGQLVITEFQNTQEGSKVYRGNDITSAEAVSGTFSGEISLTYAETDDGVAYIAMTTKEDGSGDDTSEDSYTGQIVSYDKDLLKLSIKQEDSTVTELELGKESYMLNSMSSDLLTDFTVTVSKNDDGEYAVTSASQISDTSITFNQGLAVIDESLTIKGECSIACMVTVQKTGKINFGTVNLIKEDSSARIVLSNTAGLTADYMKVVDGSLGMNDSTTLSIKDKLEVKKLEWKYSLNASVATMTMEISEGATCQISSNEGTKNEVLKNVSVINNGDLTIDGTTIYSITSGTNAVLYNTDGNLTILNK